MAGHRVRVVVADDHPIYRDGLVRSVRERPELELVGEAGEGHEALDLIRTLDPGVAILDVRMPGLGGMEILNAIQRDGLATRVVFLSASVDSEVVYRAVALGVGAYLSKEADRTAILDAVASVARGETVLSAEIQAGLATQIQLREASDRLVLTPREREVLLLMAEGLSAPDTGRRLHLSTATVKTHQGTLYAKLGVSDRAAAVAAAMRAGLLE